VSRLAATVDPISGASPAAQRILAGMDEGTAQELAAMDQAGREAWAEARLAGREPPAWQLAVLRKRLEEFRLASDGHGDWDRDEAWISRPHHAG